MSADNGIYIAKFSDGYRVAHAQAIDNILYEENIEKRKEVLKDYFGKSKVYTTYAEAQHRACEIETEILHSECPIIEYGINYIGPQEDF